MYAICYFRFSFQEEILKETERRSVKDICKQRGEKEGKEGETESSLKKEREKMKKYEGRK